LQFTKYIFNFVKKNIMFQNSEEYNEILKAIKHIKNIQAVFTCYADSIVAYSISLNNVYYEFNICTDDILYRDMYIKDLMDLENITYFGFNKFSINNNKKEFIGGIYWGQLD
jgi:UDP-glucose 4-epimerase